MEKSSIIEDLKARLENIEKGLKKKNDTKRKEDEDVCKNCGGDLQFVEDNIVYCPKCKEYFEYVPGEEKE